MEQQEEMHRHSREVYCVACIINQLGDSVLAVSESTREAFNSYKKMSETLDDSPESHRSITILVGKVYSSAHYLNYSILSKDFNYEAYLSIARNLIEKLALLNHILNKELRAVALSKQYDNSSLDILSLIEADSSEYDTLISNWLSENGWSSSTVESRVSSLGNRELVLLYAYLSRLVHGINRDDMLQRETDKHYVAGYVYLLLLTEIDKIAAKLPSGIYAEDLSKLHIKTAQDTESHWVQYGGFKAILTLTGFRDDAKGFTKLESDTLVGYNTKLEDIIAQGLQFYPKITFR